MENKIKYPVGIQTFSEIITKGYLYVDKTELVYKLVSENKYVFLSRPRRFGKSLLVSTLEEYFKGNKDLFKGLAIEKLEKDWTEHPVIRFDFTGQSYEDSQKLEDKINMYLSRYEDIYGAKDSERDIATRFNGIITRAHKKDGPRVVVLIDEYDKPLLDSIHDDGTNELIREKLQGFYSVLKECDMHIEFALLTGVGKFGHVSIFSGLNNLKDISLNPKYNSICGVSETEFHDNFAQSVSNFAEANSLSEKEVWDMFKLLYDGYHFSNKIEGIYNPFSILNAFDDEKLGAYWFTYGTPTFLINILRKNPLSITDLEGVMLTERDLSDMTDPVNNYHALFYQTGYLTIKGYDAETKRYMLDFPNEEVREGFWDSLYKQYVVKGLPSRPFDIFSFVDDVRGGHPDEFMNRLKALVSCISPGVEKQKEIHFQNVMQIIFKMLGLTVHTEVVNSMGRCDMTVETNDYVYILEFKIDSTAEAAIDQIREKGYAHPYDADQRKVFLIGADFSTRTNELDSYLIEEYK